MDVVGGDRDIVLASVWLHDYFQPQPTFRLSDHGQKAAKWAAENLAERGFPAKKVEPVCFAVANHSNRPGSIPSQDHEARVLWDADKLAHLGAHEILTLLLNNLALDRIQSMYNDPAFPEQTLTIKNLAEVRLRGLGKRESPTERFYFEPSRKWAAERFEVQRSFYESLRRQIGAHQ